MNPSTHDEILAQNQLLETNPSLFEDLLINKFIFVNLGCLKTTHGPISFCWTHALFCHTLSLPHSYTPAIRFIYCQKNIKNLSTLYYCPLLFLWQLCLKNLTQSFGLGLSLNSFVLILWVGLGNSENLEKNVFSAFVIKKNEIDVFSNLIFERFLFNINALVRIKK